MHAICGKTSFCSFRKDTFAPNYSFLVVYFKSGKAGLQLLQNVDKIKSFK